MNTRILISAIALFLAAALPASAQFRSDVPRPGDWTGGITKTDTNPKSLFGSKIAFAMNHSYEMSFSTFGRQSFNQNMYTNTMHFGFSDRMNGRVDLSLAHSPFGNGLMTQGNQVKFLVRNAELNYRIGEKTNLSVHFSQMPYGYGYDGYGMPRYGYGSGAWGRSASPFYPY